MRKLKGLESFIPVSVVNPLMLENGWTFDSDFPAATGDDLYHHDFLYQLYLRADPHYTGRVTVPVLWDKKNQTIVSNESAEIIRMFNTAFDAHGARAGDYYPVELREKIDELNGWIYDNVNNGVYKAGFATSRKRMTKRLERCLNRWNARNRSGPASLPDGRSPDGSGHSPVDHAGSL